MRLNSKHLGGHLRKIDSMAAKLVKRPAWGGHGPEEMVPSSSDPGGWVLYCQGDDVLR